MAPASSDTAQLAQHAAGTTSGPPSSDGGLMMVGELADRTGLSIKAIRRYEGLGLIYSAGRSEGNYRLFDESALIALTPDTVERLDPPDAVVSAVRPTGTIADVRAATCQLGHFFSSTAAATEWAHDHPDGYLHSVQESFRLDRQVITQLGWPAHVGQAQ